MVDHTPYRAAGLSSYRNPFPRHGRAVKTQLTLLRHGTSDANDQGILQGHADWALSDSGRAQTCLLAEAWAEAGIRFSAIISSPLSRALDTAEIIAARLESPLEEDPLLMERKWGQFESKHLAEVIKGVKFTNGVRDDAKEKSRVAA